MSNSRPQPTLVDYMAIAISPALIIVLVGSLAFFLLMVFYAGQYEGRLYWTTGCFVFAAVLISRVSIVEGAERASIFGLALGVVAALAMVKFTDHPWWAWLVLGIVWWCASHLVWNCTLVDDEDDSSGEGLLEAAGFDAALSAVATTVPVAAPTQAPSAPRKRSSAATASQSPPPAAPQSWAKRAYTWWQRSASRKAPPGLTLVYFSLAALPLFGVGQHFVQSDQRVEAFHCVLGYVASALGLLITTSFLGLRRYLRQRRLEMPVEMAGTWLGVGVVIAGAVLLLAMLIPRPNPEYAISSLTGMLSSPPREASSYAPLESSPADGDSSSAAAPNEQEKPSEAHPSTSDQKETPKAGGHDTGTQQGKPVDGKQNADDPSQSKSGSQGNASSSKSQGGSSGQQQSSSSGDVGKSQGSQGDKQKSGSTGEKQAPSQQQQQQQQQPAQQRQDGKQQPAQPGDKTQGRQAESQQQKAQQKEQQHEAQQNHEQKAAQQTSQQANSESSGESKQQQSEHPSSEQPSSERQDNQSQDAMSSRTAQALSKRWEKMPALRPPPITSFGGIAWLFKMLLYAVAAVALIYGLIRYWANVRSFLIAAWREMMALWNSIFGRKQAIEDADAPANSAQRSLRPFSAFADPFASGAAKRERPSTVVQYSFEALEAWAAERDSGRLAEETPLEFAARLADEHPPLAEGVHDLASLYAQIAYARQSPDRSDLGGVQQLWVALRRAAAPVARA